MAPSLCPRHSPASNIGERVGEDEGILFVGGGPLGKRPLIRPATAGENARRGPPSPPGDGKRSFLGHAMACPYDGADSAHPLGATCPSVPHRIFLPRGNSNMNSTWISPGAGKLSPFIRLSYISNHLVDADVSGFELQRGGLTKPRPKAWDSKTRSDKAVKGHATLDATNCSSPLQGSTFRVKAHL